MRTIAYASSSNAVEDGLFSLTTKIGVDPLAFHASTHLRRTGVNGGGGKSVHIATPAAMLAFEERYRSAYAATTDGQLPLTYHPLLLIAQAS